MPGRGIDVTDLDIHRAGTVGRIKLYIDLGLRRPGHGRLLEYLTAYDSLYLCGITRLTYELGQTRPIVRLPYIIAWIGHQAAQNSLLSKSGSTH